ncbi:serine racemase VanT catalytic subunit [Paenibacillus sp. IITD108]|uniref:serine racemase VanT catalytic subunit n=1 Tax=Paenibacillus sp. IITD108 TaxID=3116649 RepID=UPI002F3F9BD7
MKQLNAKQSYGAIDIFKLIAALFVIAIHTGPLTTYSEYGDFLLTGIIARVAVPFFFMAAGFFLFGKLSGRRKQDRSIVNKYIWRILKLYAIAVAIYIPVNIYAGYFSTDFTWYSLVKDFIFDGTLYHLWYFPALIIGVYIVAFLYHRLPFAFIMAITGGLYIVGLFGDSYYGVSVQSSALQASYDILFKIFDYTRNGLFFAPLFIAMGAWTAKRPKAIFDVNTNAGFLIICTFIMVLEGVLLHYSEFPRHDSMYIFLVPVVYFLVHLLLKLDVRNYVSFRQLSTWIYILHPLAIIIVRGAAKVTGTTNLFVTNSILHYMAVVVLSFALAAVITKFAGKRAEPSVPNRRAWAEINVTHIKHNAMELSRILPSGCGIIAVLKANGYGHGSVEAAHALTDAGITHFAVATITEAIKMREGGIKGDILILGYTQPEQFDELRRYRLTQTVLDVQYAQLLNSYKKTLDVHIKIDTGMGRVGESYLHAESIKSLYRLKYLNITGTYTHLSAPDSTSKKDIAYTDQQIRRFYTVIDSLKEAGIEPGKLHMQSSYGILNYPELRCDLARPGIALFGVLGRDEDLVQKKVDLKPALSLKATITVIKNIDEDSTISYGGNYFAAKGSRIATVSIGYADGIPRELFESGGFALVKGQRAAISGNICMDQMMLDVSAIDGVQPGDIVTFIGHDGDEQITAGQIARRCNTITNEVFCRIGERVERIYVS